MCHSVSDLLDESKIATIAPETNKARWDLSPRPKYVITLEPARARVSL
jgi:hypothetical protein